tara:strand:- start:2091 stop:2618 length:528 start_codon:yes stop_codon:yes gene_type:complete
MFSSLIVLASISVGQCSPPVYHQPYHASHNVIVMGQPVHRYIYFPYTIKTRVNVPTFLPDGKKILIPVLNGYKPAIAIRRNASGTHYYFSYKSRAKWSGASPLHYGKSKPKPKTNWRPTSPAKSSEPEMKLTAPLNQTSKPEPKPEPPKIDDRGKSLPSSIKSEERNFTKKFPRY